MSTTWLAHPNPIEIFLQPGDFYFGDAHTRIRTVLGSCVAITMWHPTLKVGGMCHYMLPADTRGGTRAPDSRYADGALALFMRELRDNGTRPRDYQVKIFGGGRMFTSAHREGHAIGALDVARRNIDTGRALLKRHGFRIVAQHMGGDGHRNVIFDIGSGAVWMRHVGTTDPDTGQTVAGGA